MRHVVKDHDVLFAAVILHSHVIWLRIWLAATIRILGDKILEKVQFWNALAKMVHYIHCRICENHVIDVVFDDEINERVRVPLEIKHGVLFDQLGLDVSLPVCPLVTRLV